MGHFQHPDPSRKGAIWALILLGYISMVAASITVPAQSGQAMIAFFGFWIAGVLILAYTSVVVYNERQFGIPAVLTTVVLAIFSLWNVFQFFTT